MSETALDAAGDGAAEGADARKEDDVKGMTRDGVGEAEEVDVEMEPDEARETRTLRFRNSGTVDLHVDVMERKEVGGAKEIDVEEMKRDVVIAAEEVGVGEME